MPQPRRIDWTAAKTFYVGLGPKRSYGKVADEFGVSTTSIGKHAREDNWAKAGADADAKASEQAIARVVRSRAERVAKTLGIVDGLLDRYDAGLDSLDLKASDIERLVKLAELLEGEATDRVTFDEMQASWRTVLGVILPFVPQAKRPDALRAAEQALGGMGIDEAEAA